MAEGAMMGKEKPEMSISGNADGAALYSLSMFVYGTLKSQYWNSVLCDGAESVVPATIRGRIYDGSYPYVVLEESTILARGTRNAVAEIAKQKNALPMLAALDPMTYAAPMQEYNDQFVQGERVRFVGRFADVNEFLANLDRLEGYSDIPHVSHYNRSLVPVRVGDVMEAAFVYHVPQWMVRGRQQIASGEWVYNANTLHFWGKNPRAGGVA
jgi:gamma-glutamylcyclotransferase (GGCT)/AIG2-like uncharacterized protein YtfP